MAEWKEPKSDYVATDQVVPKIFKKINCSKALKSAKQKHSTKKKLSHGKKQQKWSNYHDKCYCSGGGVICYR